VLIDRHQPTSQRHLADLLSVEPPHYARGAGAADLARLC
jgi:uncharacterized protein (UPF0216 family)